MPSQPTFQAIDLTSIPSRVAVYSTADAPQLNFKTILPGALPAATHGSAYSQQLAATGGSGTGYVFTALTSLPPGMTLTSGGLLAGTPTSIETKTAVIVLSDSVGNQVSGVFTLAIA